jgi:hypothetical protein
MSLTKIAGIALMLLSSAALTAGLAVAQDDADGKAAKDAKVSFTNADLAKLPTPENDRLPSADPPPGAVTLLPALPESTDEAAPATAAADAAEAVEPDAEPTDESAAEAAPAAPATPTAAVDEPAATTPDTDQVMDWFHKELERVRRQQAIDEARQRVSRAREKLERIQSSYRENGSAFSSSRDFDADQLVMTDVGDYGNKRAALVRQASAELEDAQGELKRLLAR